MNPYQEECTCDVCGGPGVTTMIALASRWTGGSLRHNDPQTCAGYLERRRKELDAREVRK